MNEEWIRRRLREGDPFAGEAGLTPDEVREMRRTVLTAMPERRRRLLPALALAGAAAAAVLIALFAFRPGAGAPPRPPRVAMVTTPSPEPAAQPPVPTPAPELRRAEKTAVHHRRHRRPMAHTRNDTLAALETSPRQEETAIREIQFSTPGGTRIIWTLTPRKALH
jgi:hypothetical protein